jgi:hypothetical protein
MILTADTASVDLISLAIFLVVFAVFRMLHHLQLIGLIVSASVAKFLSGYVWISIGYDEGSEAEGNISSSFQYPELDMSYV